VTGCAVVILTERNLAEAQLAELRESAAA